MYVPQKIQFFAFQVNTTVPKGNYGKVEMTYASTFFDSRGILLKQLKNNSVKHLTNKFNSSIMLLNLSQDSKLIRSSDKAIKPRVYFTSILNRPVVIWPAYLCTQIVQYDIYFQQYPLSFEVLNQDRGFVLYENLINKIYTDPAVLSIATLNDRGYVFVNQEFRGIFSRSQSIVTMPLSGTVQSLIVKCGVLRDKLVSTHKIMFLNFLACKLHSHLSHITIVGIFLAGYGHTRPDLA